MAYTTIDKPSDYFNTVLYTSNNGTSPRTISGVGFQPDFVWVKNRDDVNYNHVLNDNVRGLNKILNCDTTGAELAANHAAGYISSANSDGFVITAGSSNLSNYDTGTNKQVVWNWLASNSTASNTDGTITSTVSANTTAGFSIVSWTGNGVDGASIGHGLVNPNLSIIKRRNGSGNGWNVNGHPNTALFVNDGDTLNLQATFALENSATKEIDLSTDSGTTCTFVDAGNDINLNGGSFIGYFFKNIKGYSKVGSYTGNGSTNGTFVYLGFKPAFVMIKKTNATQNWGIYDNKREPFNTNDAVLFPNVSTAETSSVNYALDFVSNGFKQRATGGQSNGSGNTYLYYAVAENPFTTSTGIPCTAR